MYLVLFQSIHKLEFLIQVSDDVASWGMLRRARFNRWPELWVSAQCVSTSVMLLQIDVHRRGKKNKKIKNNQYTRGTLCIWKFADGDKIWKKRKKRKNAENVTETWGLNNSIKSVWSDTHEPPSTTTGSLLTTAPSNALPDPEIKNRVFLPNHIRHRHLHRATKHVSSDTTTTGSLDHMQAKSGVFEACQSLEGEPALMCGCPARWSMNTAVAGNVWPKRRNSWRGRRLGLEEYLKAS